MKAKRDIIVVGTSMGGLEALKKLVGDLPHDLDAAVFIVLHTAPGAPSLLADILQRFTPLPVEQASDGDPIRGGTIVVARPDYHLVLEEHKVRLTRGPKENRSRPAIDALFRSASSSHSASVIGVVLTGALDDGTAGLWSIRDRGGIGVVQLPADAAYPSMPTSAITHAGADHVTPLAEMGSLLGRLSRQSVTWEDKPVSKEQQVEVLIAKEHRGLQAGVMELGPITPYTCPECHGVLVELKEGGVPRFRCHTGHAYSVNNLLSEVTDYVEDAMWNTIRAIEESAMLLNRIATHTAEMRDPQTANLFKKKAEATQAHADIVRKALMEHQTLSEDNVTERKETAR
jgi:two-component system chemotaxis response regulator CheB